ncbi:MAG: nucleotidyltransferase domain-containing protein [Coriobacteriales bacterium]|nr:nucleotidyltransferase domain-containing protein [Coriobacteriales bacterium]
MTQTALDIPTISSLIAPVAHDYGVSKLSLFGSYARGDADGSSDVDFRIVDRGELRGLFRLAAFQGALEKRLNLPVDLVPTDSLDSAFLDRISNEEVVVYET